MQNVVRGVSRCAMLCVIVCISLGCVFCQQLAYSSDPQLLKKQATWAWPESSLVKQQFEDLIQSRLTGPEAAEARQLSQQSTSLRGVSLLEQVLALASKCDPVIAKFCEMLKEPRTLDSHTQLENMLSSLLANGAIPAWLKSDLQLAFCRYLVHNELYDEALLRLQPLSQEKTSDPATWLFCMAVCQHDLLMRAACLETLDRLLEREMELPSRYAITARLMQSDIKPLKEDSLDEIARMMNDVERRLALGRTGKQVREQEQTIVDKLDKMIDKLEQQQQQQQQQQNQKNSKSKGKSKPMGGKPMEDNQVAGDKGEGEVDQKDIGNESGWGNLPPAQRQEALQNMTKDLPSHYREVIEAYFKRLAAPSQQP